MTLPEVPVHLSKAILDLTPHCLEKDLLAMYYARVVAGQKFQPGDFPRSGHIAHEVAQDFATHYQGTFEHMLKMRDKARRGYLENYHTSGIINCWWNEVRTIEIHSTSRGEVVSKEPLGPRFETTAASVQPVAAIIKDGYYTLSFSDGSHLTLRIRVKQDDPAVQVIGALTGPSNETDYQNFGFLKTDRFIPFSAFRNGFDRWHWAVRAMLGLTEEARQAAGFLYAQESGRCCKCGMTLTDPESIRLGIGPTCRQKS